MTIKECVNKNGIDSDDFWGEIRVVFYNTVKGKLDRATFYVANPFSREGLDDLFSMHRDFCKKKRIPGNTVRGIICVEIAESYEELVKLTS